MINKQFNNNDYPFEIKSILENGGFSGYASVFDVVDSQKDIILKGAFSRAIKAGFSSIKLLWQHQMAQPIGYFTQMREDGRGLFVEGQLLLDVQKGREAYALLKSGAISGLSIGYNVVSSRFDEANLIRYIKEVDLFEISLVTFPANDKAVVVAVKSSEEDVLLNSLDKAIYALKSAARPYGNVAFDQSQPRVPAGNSDGGQWTDGGGGSGFGENLGSGRVIIPLGSKPIDSSHIVEHSQTRISIHRNDGREEIRLGGSRSWRNNNPGNLRPGKFADNHGSIGNAGGFAVFPDEATGHAASIALLKTPTYAKLTIDQAVSRRSPSSENDTLRLQNSIRKITGFSGREIVGNLNDEEISKFADAIKRTEGWIPGSTNNGI